MDCTAVAENLVAYHVGAIGADVPPYSDADREAIEQHLVDCRACLETYMAIKRAADRENAMKPRPEVLDRLRANVAAAFPPRSKEGSPSSRAPSHVAFFRRRIPLYQGIALAAVAAALTLAAPSLLRRMQRSHAPPAPMVDTSRVNAESLTIY